MTVYALKYKCARRSRAAALVVSLLLVLLATGCHASQSSSEAEGGSDGSEKRGSGDGGSDEAVERAPPSPPATYDSNGCNAELLEMRVSSGSGPEKGERTWARGHRENKEWLQEVENSVKVAWYGDSVVQLMGQYQRAEYTAWNRAVAWRQWVTLGLVGDKTEQLQYRLSNGEWSRRMEPRAVVLSVGINNILRERIYDRTSDSVVERVANRAKDDMRELIAFFHQQDCGIRVVVQAVLPTATGEKNEWPGRFTRPIERVNARFRELAEEYQHVSFIDCGDLFIEGGMLRRELLPDLLHPGPQGYPVLLGCVAEGVKAALAPRPPSPPPPMPPAQTQEPAGQPQQEQLLEEQVSLVLSGWGECSAECDGGQQTRTAACFLRTIPVDMRLCGASTHGSVQLRRECNTKPCGRPSESLTEAEAAEMLSAVEDPTDRGSSRSGAVPAAIDGDGRTMSEVLARLRGNDNAHDSSGVVLGCKASRIALLFVTAALALLYC